MLPISENEAVFCGKKGELNKDCSGECLPAPRNVGVAGFQHLGLAVYLVEFSDYWAKVGMPIAICTWVNAQHAP